MRQIYLFSRKDSNFCADDQIQKQNRPFKFTYWKIRDSKISISDEIHIATLFPLQLEWVFICICSDKSKLPLLSLHL